MKNKKAASESTLKSVNLILFNNQRPLTLSEVKKKTLVLMDVIFMISNLPDL